MFTVVAALLYSAAPAPVDLVASAQTDLLDFDQGTILVSGPASRADSIGPWAAFYLTDGSRKDGWCSAKGHPIASSFVYELEQSSTLETFHVVTLGAEEGAFPGISARAVELAVSGASGKFTTVGVYEVPKNGEKDFPLPAGTTARRVKITVDSNWGNADYSEIMEVDLYGKKDAAPPQVDVSGAYYSPQWQGLRLTQSGTSIEGCYDFNDGTFSGELDGRVARVLWQELVVNGKPHSKGSATFVVGPDRSMQGIYFVDGDLEVRGTWDLSKAEGPQQVAKCQPPAESSLAEQLRRTGRMVLYGLRFDVNSAVLRKESEKTLNEIFEALRHDLSLKVLVEGHTDSTNTDAYNQTLSEQRAKAVVDWLLAKGIQTRRLKAKGFGRTRPVASNNTAQGRALNRRVELSVIR
jgi:outer membrane protein OmpA-like peptidoglycan-associated protein